VALPFTISDANSGMSLISWLFVHKR